jgi:SNF family Na+-dependent transporter
MNNVVILFFSSFYSVVLGWCSYYFVYYNNVVVFFSSFYSVVLGWCFYYFVYYCANDLPVTADESRQIFRDYAEVQAD